MLYSILVFLLVLVSILLIGIILLQSGQGDMGAAMGGNTMNQAFGSEGADKLLVRITTTLAAIFMVLAISIQWFGKSNEMERFDSVDQGLPAINTEVETNQSNEGIPLPSDSE
ncbi:MAG: preprotein translocase subunit SecG [Candidatus Pelagibacter sp. TMED273]|nr:MAG: preprotein translocase subunit SecG [Candidatus Pelagibacter sp. TMED273]|tara:strand:+ start:3705 stop:4043 length:339 start_codon:yes stop_codon:yes gene_type:complete